MSKQFRTLILILIFPYISAGCDFEPSPLPPLPAIPALFDGNISTTNIRLGKSARGAAICAAMIVSAEPNYEVVLSNLASNTEFFLFVYDKAGHEVALGVFRKIDSLYFQIDAYPSKEIVAGGGLFVDIYGLGSVQRKGFCNNLDDLQLSYLERISINYTK